MWSPCWGYVGPMLDLCWSMLKHVEPFERHLWLVLANFVARNTPQQQLGVVEVVLGLVFESGWPYVESMLGLRRAYVGPMLEHVELC